MSEYQYYSFLAVDQPLSREQIAELRSLSSRAEITATSFENHYNYGDFRGDPKALVEQYFDAFLYLANWGSRQLMLRLPAEAFDLAMARCYCHADSAAVWASADDVILDLSVEGEGGEDDWDVSGSGWLASIIPVRADLMAGDQRALYLAWLLSVQNEQYEDGYEDEDAEDDPSSDLEPPVPPGLGQLTASLQSFADFLRLDPDLVEAAAERSESLRVTEPPAVADLDRWISGLPLAEKDEVLRRLLLGESVGLQTGLLRRYRQTLSDGDGAGCVTGAGRRTVGQLLEAAATRRVERERLEAAERVAEQARRDQAAAQVRRRRLVDLAGRGESAWTEIETLIATKKPGEYDRAVALLVDLHELAVQSGADSAFDRRVIALRRVHERKPSLLGRLNAAGLASEGEQR